MADVDLNRHANAGIAANHEPIPGLNAALDLRRMQPILAVLADRNLAGRESVQLVSSELVRYKPGRRCMVRYELDCKVMGIAHRQTFLGKIRARGFDRKTYRLTSQFWKGEFGPTSADAIRVPEPVAAFPEFNMWLQRWVDAKTLAEQLDSPQAEELCSVAATALHKLHTKGPRSKRVHDKSDEIRILGDALIAVRNDIPCLSQRIAAVLRACRKLVLRLEPHTPLPIHRDFYPDQLLIAGDSAWLLDLDLYAEGDPALDLGNFVAHLQETSLRRFGHFHGYVQLERAFLEGYRAASKRALSFSIQAYVTLALARHIAISRRIPSRRQTTEAILTHCEQRLGLCSAGSSWMT